MENATLLRTQIALLDAMDAALTEYANDTLAPGAHGRREGQAVYHIGTPGNHDEVRAKITHWPEMTSHAGHVTFTLSASLHDTDGVGVMEKIGRTLFEEKLGMKITENKIDGLIDDSAPPAMAMSAPGTDARTTHRDGILLPAHALIEKNQPKNTLTFTVHKDMLEIPANLDDVQHTVQAYAEELRAMLPQASVDSVSVERVHIPRKSR